MPADKIETLANAEIPFTILTKPLNIEVLDAEIRNQIINSKKSSGDNMGSLLKPGKDNSHEINTRKGGMGTSMLLL